MAVILLEKHPAIGAPASRELQVVMTLGISHFPAAGIRVAGEESLQARCRDRTPSSWSAIVRQAVFLSPMGRRLGISRKSLRRGLGQAKSLRVTRAAASHSPSVGSRNASPA